MIAEEADKQIANPLLSEEQREKIAKAQNRNNSDIDFCECGGRLIINYSWGNQVGTEFIAEAEYAGSVSGFLQSWFPVSTSNGRGSGRPAPQEESEGAVAAVGSTACRVKKETMEVCTRDREIGDRFMESHVPWRWRY